ncbi:MAG TPA: SusF/SusE family outer membrane protein, partial [Saprospiraceae bacterium]|nr:SusF/SusE family outer membrane protein [Saprospiraceae bacterium]
MLRLLSTLLFCAAALIGYSQITTVGIIGTATPNGWDSDTDMVQDAADTAKWTLTITLVQGEAKFRANNGWDVNWGDSAFPIGTGTQGGPNIPVPAGTYNISFNSVTGAYFFDLVSDIGIIGSATPFGWDREVFMFQSEADTNQYSLTLNLAQGEAKFRANGNWDVNWGAADFPAGIGTPGGPNIPIAQAGKYLIEFNKATGAYNFTEQVEFTSIGVIGSATAGGWDAETALTRDSGNPDLWKGTVTLTEGELKFRANNAWAINWGGGEFPSDTATVNGDNIAVPTAGDYLVSFNTRTLIYTF